MVVGGQCEAVFQPSESHAGHEIACCLILQRLICKSISNDFPLCYKKFSQWF